jgi:LuxR family maltose regulon positive regulatory protein
VALDGLRLAKSTESTAILMWLLPVTAVILYRQGKVDQAARLLTLISTHPLSQAGWMKKWMLLGEIQAELEQELEAAILEIKSLSPKDILTEINTRLDSFLGEGQDQASTLEMDSTLLANQALIDPLTNRELEVLQLIAKGLSNREIAEKLFISTGTAKYYSSQIYRKLQVTSRTQATAHARELGILQT